MASAIAYRHCFPTRPIAPSMSDIIPTRKFQARHFPFILLCISFIGWLIAYSYFADFSLSVLSFFISWLYIRYFMFFKFAGVRGDHSPDFAFEFLLPKITRGFVSVLAQTIYKMMRGLGWELRAPGIEERKGMINREGERRKKGLEYLEKNFVENV